MNTKKISLAYLLAIYLKFNAPSITFHSSTKFSLQKKIVGLQEKYWTKAWKKEEKERFMSPSLLSKFQVQN